MASGAPPIRAFLSYAHADDNEFAFVDPLTRKLKAFVRSKSGRDLEIFIDRESIGWGDNWRASISSSVENATIFIPVLSANYLDSEPCREEFLAFHSKAEVSGVTDLILPILLFKSPLFAADSTDEVAAIAESLQYKLIEEAVIEGFESPEWKRCTRDLAESLAAAVGRAEDALVASASLSASAHIGAAATVDSDRGRSGSVPGGAAEPTSAPLSIAVADLGEGSERQDGDDTAGLAEVMVRIEAAVEDMNEAASRLGPEIEQFGDIPEAVGEFPPESTPKDIAKWTFRMADAFKVPAINLEVSGKELFEATKQLDEALLELDSLVVQVGADTEFGASLQDAKATIISNFGDIKAVSKQLDSLLDGIKPAEVISVGLRRSIQPARRGLTSVRDSLKLIESWQPPTDGDFDALS